MLRVLDATPAPRGHERAAATALREWCTLRWPDLDWTVEPHGEDGANLVASCGPGPLLYSHLDTSLDGMPSDAVVTGRVDGPGPLRIADGLAEGFGVGVARGPAAAALVAFATARRGTLLLSGSGTHRRGGSAEGVLAYLRTHGTPCAAIIAKCGPRGVLWEEPGAGYLRLRVAGRHGAALAPGSAVPAGGIAAAAGAVLAAIARWRQGYVDLPRPPGQAGAEAGVGTLRAGWDAKPDLLPAELLVDLYVVLPPATDLRALAAELATVVRTDLALTPLAACEVSVAADLIHSAAGTAATAPIVCAARVAWAEEFTEPPAEITGWTGSTDGVVLRAYGVDTVRVGPQSDRSAADPRRDVLRLADLASFARIYAALLRQDA